MARPPSRIYRGMDVASAVLHQFNLDGTRPTRRAVADSFADHVVGIYGRGLLHVHAHFAQGFSLESTGVGDSIGVHSRPPRPVGDTGRTTV